MAQRSTARARSGIKGRGVGSRGGPIETKTARIRERVLDRLRSERFRGGFGRIARELWEAEAHGKPSSPLSFLKALRSLPNYHLVPQNVREELMCETLASLSWHVKAAEGLGVDGNARMLPRYFNHDAGRRGGDVEQPYLSLGDAFVEDACRTLGRIARRYEKGQPVRELLDQDVGDDDALFQVTVPARGFANAIGDAREWIRARLDEIEREGTGPSPWFLYSRSQRTAGTKEPDELSKMLVHELQDIATDSGSIPLIWSWLNDERGSNRRVAQLLLRRKGGSLSVKTAESRLSKIRCAWLSVRHPETGEIVWPHELDHSYGPMRGDLGPWDTPKDAR